MSDSLYVLDKLISFDTTISKNTFEAVYFVKDYLESKQIKTHLVYNNDKTRASLLATVGDENSAGIILSGHLDTVAVIKEEWNTNPHELTEIGTKLFGRGTSDMKGGIACALGNIDALKASGKTFHFSLTHDEEGIFSAIKQLNQNNFDGFFKQKPLGCIVMEPTLLKPIYGHKGTYLGKINIIGKESHSAYPYLGVDAMSYMVKIYNKIMSIMEKFGETSARDENYNPDKTSFNICTFKSGDAINKIPGFAEISFCMRYLPQDDIQLIFNEIKNYCSEIEFEMKKQDENCSVSFTEILNVKGFESDINSEFVKKFPNPTKVSYATEGGYFQEMGINTIVYGPGSIEQAHIKNEFIEKSQLEAFDKFIQNELCNF
ncbi:MAG: M20/M25/M40 family metallo-hydrolase [Alphaproteobacteria bacterium]